MLQLASQTSQFELETWKKKTVILLIQVYNLIKAYDKLELQ